MMKQSAKKCKSQKTTLKNATIQEGNQKLCAKHKFSGAEIKLLSWIKTLLAVRRFLPNIICLVDKQILSMAESSYSSSFIFGDMLNGTYNQVEQILSMEQRKMSLVNAKMIIDEIFNSLDEKYRAFVSLKYYQNKNFPSVATSLQIDERTAYRWNKLILVKLLKYCKLNNYTNEFFELQLENEKWMLPHFEKSFKSICVLFGDSK